MKKIFVADYGKFPGLGSGLKKHILKLLNFSKKNNFGISVYLVKNAEMREINKKYLGKDKATNVLSFPRPKDFKFPPKSPKILGEIYLAPDYIKTKNEDIAYLLVHGFLHLLGFDHEKKNDRIKMERKELALLKKLISN